jgi:hypothetical protein
MSKLTHDQREVRRLKRALRDVRALAVNGLKPVTPSDTRDAYGKRADALRDVRQAVTAALSKKAETPAEEEYSYAEWLEEAEQHGAAAAAVRDGNGGQGR